MNTTPHPTLDEHTRAVLVQDLPDHALVAGDVGVIVHVYRGGAAYEVEFLTLDGHTLDVVTVPHGALRPISGQDVLHARPR